MAIGARAVARASVGAPLRQLARAAVVTAPGSLTLAPRLGGGTAAIAERPCCLDRQRGWPGATATEDAAAVATAVARASGVLFRLPCLAADACVAWHACAHARVQIAHASSRAVLCTEGRRQHVNLAALARVTAIAHAFALAAVRQLATARCECRLIARARQVGHPHTRAVTAATAGTLVGWLSAFAARPSPVTLAYTLDARPVPVAVRRAAHRRAFATRTLESRQAGAAALGAAVPPPRAP